jgi:DNA-binding MarR family transcriptional regulator
MAADRQDLDEPWSPGRDQQRGQERGQDGLRAREPGPEPERQRSQDPDHETRTREGDHLALRLWLRLLSCSQRVETELRQRLREQFDGSLPRFDLMAQLDRHPQGLKMRELSQRLMVTGGNVTGLTDRLVAEGLVERQEDAHDRRAFSVRLTDEGRRQFRLMAREHEDWVAAIFGGMTPVEQTHLFELLGSLKRTLPPMERRPSGAHGPSMRAGSGKIAASRRTRRAPPT